MKSRGAGELPDFTEERLEGDVRYLGRLITVEDDMVKLPDGKIAAREVVRHPGAVVILPVLEGGEIVMVWQYRYPIGAHSLELPAGKREKGEAEAETARRELLEETGYEAASLERTLTMHSSVGFSDEKLDLFVATGLSHKGREMVEGEFIHVCPIRIDDALARISEGRVTDSKTVAGLLWAKLNLGERA